MGFTKILVITLSFAVFFASSFMLFEPGNDPTGYFGYVSGIGIINPRNNVPVGSVLEVKFLTDGKGDLRADTVEGDLQFLELRCGDERIEPVMAGNHISYKDYKCEDESVLSVKVLSENIDIRLKFGRGVQHIKNSV